MRGYARTIADRSTIRLSFTAALAAALASCASSSDDVEDVDPGGAAGMPDTGEPVGGAAGEASGGGAAGSDAGMGGMESSGGAPSEQPEPEPEPPEACELLYREGHGDLYFSYVADSSPSLSIRAALEGQPQEELYDPSRVCIVVPIASRDSVVALGGAPEGEQFAFLGVAPGEAFWLLPATARAGMPWLGIATERVPATRYVELEIAMLSAPEEAHFAAWQTDALGTPEALLSTYTSLSTTSFAAGRHLHLNWSFSQHGLYELSFTVTGRSASDDEEAGGVLQPVRFWVEAQ